MRKTMITFIATLSALCALAAFGGVVNTAAAQEYGLEDRSEIGGMECSRGGRNADRCGGWAGEEDAAARGMARR